jgi:hypothetical protein
VRHALDLVLALPSASAAGQGGLHGALDALHATPRHRLRPPTGPRLVDITAVTLMAYGVGATLALAALAKEERASCRIGAAVLGFFGPIFPWSGFAGAAPPPPADEFAARMATHAQRVLTPLLYVCNEDDDEVPLAAARTLFGHVRGTTKQLRLLPGGRGGGMSVGSLRAQEAWMFAAADKAHAAAARGA